MTATTFQGMITPEPSSYAVLGLGAVGFLMRRQLKFCTEDRDIVR
jgi:hypothetical protein